MTVHVRSCEDTRCASPAVLLSFTEFHGRLQVYDHDIGRSGTGTCPGALGRFSRHLLPTSLVVGASLGEPGATIVDGPVGAAALGGGSDDEPATDPPCSPSSAASALVSSPLGGSPPAVGGSRSGGGGGGST